MGQTHWPQRAFETQVRLLLLIESTLLKNLNICHRFFAAEIVFRKPVTYSDQSTRMWWQTYFMSIVWDAGGGGQHAATSYLWFETMLDAETRAMTIII